MEATLAFELHHRDGGFENGAGDGPPAARSMACSQSSKVMRGLIGFALGSPGHAPAEYGCGRLEAVVAPERRLYLVGDLRVNRSGTNGRVDWSNLTPPPHPSSSASGYVVIAAS